MVSLYLARLHHDLGEHSIAATETGPSSMTELVPVMTGAVAGWFLTHFQPSQGQF